ncbi:MAG TPA: chromate transporter, partial [Pyrinomonadaceae bacterium]|nr:chromate transporter [Pyrinomonadaceae bacterium]
KQLLRLRNLSTIVSRRRARVRTRLVRQRRPQGREQLFGNYWWRRFHGEDTVEAAPAQESDTARVPEEEEDATVKLRSVGGFALAMPLLAKLSLLLTLSSIFLRVGSVTFGGGLVMLPLIESEVVNTHQWLTHQEFADAFALGQITPGPVLITATFVGYRVAGTLGALVATISIFLPAFVMTIAAGSSLRRFRNNEQVQSFLRGIAPAVVGLLLAAALSIGRAGIHSWLGVTIMLLTIFILVRYRPNAFWVIFGAGFLRYLAGLVFG